MTDNAIVIGSDHAGYSLKQVLVAHLEEKGWTVVDVGTNGLDSVDYPDFGISIAANRHDWVRAGLCHDTTSARLCRLHNDANVLALGARLIGEEVAKDCVDVFLATDFEGGRHQRRVDKLGFAESM